MIIECIGLPGVGKTTMTEKVAALDLRVRIPPKYPGKRYAYAFVLLHPLYSLSWFSVLLIEGWKTGTLRLTRFKCAGFGYTAARFQYVLWHTKKEGAVFLLDEGMVQRFLSLYEHRVSKDIFLRWLPAVPISHLVVSLHGEPFEPMKASPIRTAFGEEYIKTNKEILRHNHRELYQSLLSYNADTLSCESSECADMLAEKLKAYAPRI